MKTCEMCKTQLFESDKWCSNCGRKVKWGEKTKPEPVQAVVKATPNKKSEITSVASTYVESIEKKESVQEEKYIEINASNEHLKIIVIIFVLLVLLLIGFWGKSCSSERTATTTVYTQASIISTVTSNSNPSVSVNPSEYSLKFYCRSYFEFDHNFFDEELYDCKISFASESQYDCDYVYWGYPNNCYFSYHILKNKDDIQKIVSEFTNFWLEFDVSYTSSDYGYLIWNTSVDERFLYYSDDKVIYAVAYDNAGQKELKNFFETLDLPTS